MTETQATPGAPGESPLFAPGDTTVHSDPAQLARVTRALRATGRRIVLVPTMGALHRGHRELIRRAKRVPNTIVVVSIFVNPRQFGAGEDFERYPRDLDTDVAVCRAEQVELVFAPTAAAMYGAGTSITVSAGPLGDELEGASRPGHFAGVLTVVAKLLNIVRPDFAFFGEKDYQQLVLLRRMGRELDFDASIVGIPTIREHDGLALSSRNVYLDAEARNAAVVLSAALTAGVYAARSGGDAARVLATAREVLDGEPALDVDYLELRDVELNAVDEQREARLLVAARVGAVRLIDNVAIAFGTAEEQPGEVADAPAADGAATDSAESR
ncbi:pantoate--beta-alanine ligase [Actinoalloteichus hymeniacidonis]|uniref:Pantothenate synthetase n=1 Tax=Actinoalloteichus hymeniacidonis TaxID=340345 RepID=A0AAC9HKN8_9PSEU|nr:pantoate--beta-alanine ligase [Actinoalloteichus hymeniacidonis]AOS61182.1 pantothenate synthetase [Actinoalloteichus hymeniacidonis]MBB5910817.1 pantoate--beta-alanine ligase [Actinoalloteichus hymeniacidonis]